jgi:hypothetical protein
MSVINYRKHKEPPSLGICQWTKDFLKTQDRLIRGYYMYQHISGVHLEPMAELLAQCCPRLDHDAYPIEDCVQSLSVYLGRYVGKTLQPSDIDDIAVMIAGCGDEFARGEIHTNWDPTRGVWGSLYVEDMYRLTGEEQRFKCRLHIRQGPACGIRIDRVYRLKGIRAVMRDISGNRFENYEPMDFGGLWFTAWLKSDCSYFTVDDTFASPRQLTYNRKTLKARAGKCIHTNRKDKDCSINCPYGRDECALARHKFRYKFGPCRNLQTAHKGYLMREGYCIKCLMAGATIDETRKEKDEDDSG